LQAAENNFSRRGRRNSWIRENAESDRRDARATVKNEFPLQIYKNA